MTVIPVLDMRTDEAEVASAIDRVCSDIGFFQIIGHGVDPLLMDHTWKTVRAFFDLPLAERLAVARPRPDYPFAYVPMAGETLSNSISNGGQPDLKETFNMGPVVRPINGPTNPDEQVLFLPTLWPPTMASLRPTLEAYFVTMDELAGRILRLCAIGLGLDADFFATRIDVGTTALRALNYPDQPVPPPPGQLRAGAHTDYGTITILRQDAAPGGLEVLDHRTNTWMGVPSIPGAFVINVGDMLAQWTNDRWRSTMHRVVNPSVDAGARRQSMAFFHNANFHCEVACLPSCTSPNNPPRYAPVLAGPHLLAKFRRTG